MNSLQYVSQNGVCPFITYMQDIYYLSILKQSYCLQPLYHVDTTKSLYNAGHMYHVDITMLTFHAGTPEHHCSDRRVPPSVAECWS